MISNIPPEQEERFKEYDNDYFHSIISLPRMPFNKRSLSGSHSSHSNLSQASVTSDLLAADDVDSPVTAQHAKIAERRSNSSTDIQGTQVYI